MNKIKSALLFSVALISIGIYLYFPIFCFVKEIDVQGNTFVNNDEIIQTSELSGKLLTLINKERVEKRLLSIKIIKNIKFEQKSLSKIKIYIEEKKIVMLAQIGEKTGYVDSENNFIEGIGEYVGVNFPIFTSDSAKSTRFGIEILDLFNKIKIFTPENISEIAYSEITGLTVFTTQDTTIYIGKGNFEMKLRNLQLILEDGKAKGKKEDFIDISNETKAIVKYSL